MTPYQIGTASTERLRARFNWLKAHMEKHYTGRSLTQDEEDLADRVATEADAIRWELWNRSMPTVCADRGAVAFRSSDLERPGSHANKVLERAVMERFEPDAIPF